MYTIINHNNYYYAGSSIRRLKLEKQIVLKKNIFVLQVLDEDTSSFDDVSTLDKEDLGSVLNKMEEGRAF